MLRCASCAAALSETDAVCPQCGARMDVSDARTGTAVRGTPPAARATPGSASRSATAAGSGPSNRGRFVPGTVLAERYRIVGLLGKGGMGEVYEAEDLKLDQTVALKFLPELAADDPERLERFFGEVRVARQITHHGICRVHDIGEAEGLHFLSMEYVDGEDLASLLRRIGRLPGGKALSIARQVCAGLAAAHDKGVLHRDLKPANVMIDGRGDARIMDFGLAGLAEAFQGAEVKSGTPAYMSPEQLEGREVTVRSDVYALGLVLYELFTGKRAFDGRTLQDITRQQREEAPPDISAIVGDVDPAVERVILRCLEKDPLGRPPSALAVAVALPGGDPLAAALAAGETPSPELVAAAGERGALRPRVALACLAAVIVGSVVYALLRPAFREVPLPKPPDALEDRARELLGRLGYTEEPAGSARGWLVDYDYVQHVSTRDASPQRWNRLRQGQPAVMSFWYRQSPRPLAATRLAGVVSYENPPPLVSGMAGVEIDPRGRLLGFYRVTPQHEASAKAPPGSPDWSVLFTEAGLSQTSFTEVAPEWTPPFYCDMRAAWKGAFPEQPGVEARVEAAAYRGRPVYFAVLPSWERPDRQQVFTFTAGQQVARYLGMTLAILLLGGSIALARRNLRLGRIDRRGALRLANAVGWVTLASWMLEAGHVPDFPEEMGLLIRGVGLAMVLGGFMWLMYLALEPAVRRRWPGRIVSWTRLLAGRLRDPLVGRDVLVGTALGVAAGLVNQLGILSSGLFGLPGPPMDPFLNLNVLLGAHRLAAELLDMHIFAVGNGLALLFLLLFLTVVFRREWVAVAVMTVVLALQDALWVGSLGLGLLRFASSALLILVFAVALLRFGILTLTAGYLVFRLLHDYPVGLSLSGWYAGPCLAALAVTVAWAVYGFRTSLAGQAVFRDLPHE